MKREELDVCTLNGEGIETWMVDCEGTEIWTTDSNGNKYYYKSQADKVMDDYESKIKNLEKANAELIKRVQTLEEECNKLEDENQRLFDECYESNGKVLELESQLRTSEELKQKWFFKMRDLEAKLSTMETSYDALIKNTVNVKNDVELKLQNRIKELEADAELDQKKRLMLCRGYNQKCERVKELEEDIQLIEKKTDLQADRIKELEATISKMETTAPKWISVNDRLPKGSPMLPALTEEGDRIWWGNWHDNNLEIYGITHWLDNAFPPPPTTEEK